MVDLVNAYREPEKYAQEIETNKIVADEKVHDVGVGRYVHMIEEGIKIKPIIVIKHPKKDEYAVLNGHHRFWAYKELDVKSVRAVIVEDYVGLGFHLTKNGHFQPSPEFTKYVRTPAKALQAYFEEFLKNPEAMLRKQLEEYKSRYLRQ